MKNILTIENGIAILLSNVDDGTNTIFINGAEIPASSWVGSGVYQYTESGVTFTIQKTNANTGNIMLQLVQGTAYRLVKQFEGEPYNSGDPLDTDLADEDYVPFYDASTGTRKNSLWSNIVAKLKDIFVKKSGDTMSGNLTIDKKNGTPNVEAWSYVMLGNDTPVTQDKNSTGVIRFFTQGTSYIDLVAAKTDAVRYQQLQNKSGTIALLSDTNPFVSINNKTTLAEVGAVIDDAFNDLGNNVGALWGYCFANTCSALGWWASGATFFCISNSTTFRQAVFLCNGSPSIRIIYKNEGVWRELDNNGFAPYPHAISSTYYGGGNDTNYGHVKLSDSYTTSGGAASASVAASSKAVADLYGAIRYRNGSVATTAINSSTAPGIIVHPAFLGFFGNIRVNRTSATGIVSGTYNSNTKRYAPLLSITAANAQAILANKMPTTTGPINPIFVTPSGLSSSVSGFSWFLYRKDANTYYILNDELSAANDTELNAKLNGKDYIYKIVGQCIFKY